MELALNLGWFALAVGVFCVFAFCFVSELGYRSQVTAYIALVCVVCLLFPVISMTDDLNSNPAIPEATKLKRLLHSAQYVAHLFSHVFIAAPRERGWDALALELKPVHTEFLSFDLSRRPPPSFLSL